MATNSTDLQRAPHRATRALVEHDGSDTARELYDLFETYNRRYFDGKLEQALILIIETTSRRSLADYCRKDEQGLQSRIRLAPRVAFSTTYGPKLAADALLHEMVHAWLYEVERDTEDGYRGHGPKFAAKCNEIGKALGLPEVSAKGRGGLPDCAHWPCNVRPADYYAAPWKPSTRAPNARPSEPADGTRGASWKAKHAADAAAAVDEDLDEDGEREECAGHDEIGDGNGPTGVTSYCDGTCVLRRAGATEIAKLKPGQRNAPKLWAQLEGVCAAMTLAQLSRLRRIVDTCAASAGDLERANENRKAGDA